jgi:hypothetical protein
MYDIDFLALNLSHEEMLEICKRLDKKFARFRRRYSRKDPLLSYEKVYQLIFVEAGNITQIAEEYHLSRERIYQLKRFLWRAFSFYSDKKLRRSDITKTEEKKEIAEPEPVIKLKMSISPFELSVRLYNCLKRAGITTVSQLLLLSDKDFLSIRHFGKKTLWELNVLKKELLTEGTAKYE